MTVCEHLEVAPNADAPEELACVDCVEHGGGWISLRQCLDCGHVGCCDSSPAQHASAHYQATGHTTARSVEPGELWRICFEHRLIG